jgi:hypothetical protein
MLMYKGRSKEDTSRFMPRDQKRHPVRLAYLPPASSTFLSEQTSYSNQPTVLFSQNKPAPAISHQPNEQATKHMDGPHGEYKEIEAASVESSRHASNAWWRTRIDIQKVTWRPSEDAKFGWFGPQNHPTIGFLVWTLKSGTSPVQSEV